MLSGLRPQKYRVFVDGRMKRLTIPFLVLGAALSGDEETPRN